MTRSGRPAHRRQPQMPDSASFAAVNSVAQTAPSRLGLAISALVAGSRLKGSLPIRHRASPPHEEDMKILEEQQENAIALTIRFDSIAGLRDGGVRRKTAKDPWSQEPGVSSPESSAIGRYADRDKPCLCGRCLPKVISSRCKRKDTSCGGAWLTDAVWKGAGGGSPGRDFIREQRETSEAVDRFGGCWSVGLVTQIKLLAS